MQKFLLFAFALLAFSACNDSDSDEIRFATENTAIADGSLTGINLHFLGTSVATAPDGTAYTDSSARFEFAGGSEKLTLYMHGTRFAAAMPAFNMRLFNVPYTPGEGAALSFLLPTVVPDVYLPNAVGGGYSYQHCPPTPSPTSRVPSTVSTAASHSRATFPNWAPTALNTKENCSHDNRPCPLRRPHPPTTEHSIQTTMKPEYRPFVEELIELCIKEDIGDGDHTSLCCIPADEHGRMRLLCKQEGTIAGIEIAELVLRRLDPGVKFEQLLRDGDRVKPGDVAFYVSGRLRSLLQAERILLNIMQRMSGVATQTAVYVARLEGLHTKVLDTRKTTPGMRVLDKMAVKIGGGENHRMGLFDMVLLKDNHIDFAGGIRKAIQGAREYLAAKGKQIPIECEVRTLEDIDEVFAAGGADRIMFDNFSPELTREAVRRVAGRCETESSGGITLDNLRQYAECGVDFISVGALTHQIKSLDMSLKACE